MSKKNFKLSARIDESNPNHHIWNNNGTWYIHFIIHKEDKTAERFRKSLKTRDVEEARNKRDKILERLMKD
tara:strand:- start:769 stop:981 length:213 start_codon:yes stop_codon:yes gene_type:complete